MNNQNEFVSRFYVYPKEIERFIEYCKRFQCIKDVKIKFTIEEEKVDEDSFIWNPAFICDVTHFSQNDSLKFVNVFSLFFTLSKYCSRI